MMVHRGQAWDSMGRTGKSKKIDPLLADSTDNFPASSDTYRQVTDSPQANSISRKYSRFVPVDNFVEGFGTLDRHGLRSMTAIPPRR
jgi:hypothetical protein